MRERCSSQMNLRRLMWPALLGTKARKAGPVAVLRRRGRLLLRHRAPGRGRGRGGGRSRALLCSRPPAPRPPSRASALPTSGSRRRAAARRLPPPNAPSARRRGLAARRALSAPGPGAARGLAASRRLALVRAAARRAALHPLEQSRIRSLPIEHVDAVRPLQQQPEVLDFERVRRAVLRQQARAVRRAVDEVIRKRKQPLLRLRAQRIRRHRLLRVEPLQQLAQLLRR